MLGRTLVLSGGKMDLNFAGKYLSREQFDTVLCADSGLNAADALGLDVQYFMGDFDSVSPSVLERFQKGEISGGKSAQWVQYPPEKDATDTEIVLDWIVEQGADEIVLLGATGGRLDHFLSIVNLLMHPLKAKIPAYILDPWNKICLIDQPYRIQRKEQYGTYISLQPLTEVVTGITLIGMKYPLQDASLSIGTSLAVSNELAEGAEEAVIELKTGILIVTESKDASNQ